jgi:hypothetical protein
VTPAGLERNAHRIWKLIVYRGQFKLCRIAHPRLNRVSDTALTDAPTEF